MRAQPVLLQTIQRVVLPAEGLPYTEWLLPDRATFTSDARVEHYQGEYEEAAMIARVLAHETGAWVFSVDVDRSVVRIASPAPSLFSGEHNCGRPRRRVELEERDLRELDERANYG